jgi:hypothetical protein
MTKEQSQRRAFTLIMISQTTDRLVRTGTQRNSSWQEIRFHSKAEYIAARLVYRPKLFPCSPAADHIHQYLSPFEDTRAAEEWLAECCEVRNDASLSDRSGMIADVSVRTDEVCSGDGGFVSGGKLAGCVAYCGNIDEGG